MEIDIAFDIPGVEAGVVSDLSLAPGVVMPVQTHSCNVTLTDGEASGHRFADTDALICNSPGMKIGVRTADCVPVLIYSPDIKSVAAIHAGWRGSLGGIVTLTVERLRAMGADPAEMRAAFGPCISGECYEVSRELATDFRNAGFGTCLNGERNLDLEAVNRMRLVNSGVLPENIQGKTHCTFLTPQFPSWRRSPTGRRLVTWIALRED